jgi:hypothetical protein
MLATGRHRDFRYGGEVDTIFEFEKEDDALQWIKEKSRGWLLAQK